MLSLRPRRSIRRALFVARVCVRRRPLSIGRNIRHLIDRPDEEYCFRLQKDRVYYLSESLMKSAANIDREHLVSLGTCFGKFTKTKKFRLHITCLDYLSQYSKYKIWIKPNGEMSFLYGNNVLKAHLGRITENTPQYQGVVFCTYARRDMHPRAACFTFAHLPRCASLHAC
jgi:ribosome biogenesis protein Nip4